MDTKIKNKKVNSLEELIEKKYRLDAELENKIIISVCSGPGCIARGSTKIYNSLKKEIESIRLYDSKNIMVKKAGCLGFCEMGPVVTIYPGEICYFKVSEKDIPAIVEKTVKGEIFDPLLYRDESGEPVVRESEIPFYKYQKRIILNNFSKIDYDSIDDYIRIGGYRSLGKALNSMTAEEVLEEVKNANLRGRGGGGFPAGVKWESTRNAPGTPKYVIVNADEGDPGAFMDRAILEGCPHMVLEGLIIGAYAIGAGSGYIYIRHEYPNAIKNIEKAIDQAKNYGFLGKNILGSGFDFDVKVHMGAGAYVSGESSALMSAIEGKVGEPRLKYIRSAVRGLWERPTNLNNVETWANVPLIIDNGSGWFRGIGNKKNSGTKIFSLVGKVKNTGLIEVPLGITLRDVIFKIGGGIKGGKKFKAVQTGGPSGGVIPEELLDLPVDFDELTKAGSIMGSGGMIVMDESDCMVNLAHYYIKFLASESCGKCVPCREGIRQMLYIYERIISGKGKESDLKLLSDLSMLMKEASLCALGKTVPNIVLTTIKYFREEYEAHIFYNTCPAKVCRKLISYVIDEKRCSGCGACVKVCPSGAIKGEPRSPHYIDNAVCTRCGACVEACPDKYNAIMKRAGTSEIVAETKMEEARSAFK